MRIGGVASSRRLLVACQPPPATSAKDKDRFHVTPKDETGRPVFERIELCVGAKPDLDDYLVARAGIEPAWY